MPNNPEAGKLSKLKILVDKVVDNATVEKDYYEKQKTLFRRLSRITRAVTFLIVIAAIWLSFSRQDYAWLNELFGTTPGAALFFVALTAVFVAFDKLYLISGNWKRFSIANLSIQEIIETANFKWERLKIEASEAGIDEATMAAALDFYEVKLSELFTIIKKETSNWGSELDTAMNGLQSVVNSARQQADINVQAAVARAQQQNRPSKCIVKISLQNQTDLVGQSLSLTIGDRAFQRSGAEQMVFPEIDVINGHVMVKVTPPEGTPIETVEPVTAGHLLEITL